MMTIQGKGVSSGIGMGPLYFYRRASAEIKFYTVEDTDAEWQRFKDAQGAAVAQLGELAEKARVEAGDDRGELLARRAVAGGEGVRANAVDQTGFDRPAHRFVRPAADICAVGKSAEVRSFGNRNRGVL